MKIDLKELGKRIKLTRKGQDLTQEMLAEKAGVSQHYIYEIEAGRKAMSIHSFASLTTALDVSADYLLFGDGQRIFDVDTPAHHNNQLMEIAAELNPSQRDHQTLFFVEYIHNFLPCHILHPFYHFLIVHMHYLPTSTNHYLQK